MTVEGTSANRPGFKKTEIGEIPVEWEVRPFETIAEIGPQNGLYKSKEEYGEGTPMIDMGDLFASDVIQEKPRRRVRLTQAEVEKFQLQEGDLIFARRSLVAEGSGKCSMLGVFSECPVFESSIIRFRLQRGRCCPKLYMYFWESPMGKTLRWGITRQVAVSGVTGKDLGALLVPVPPLPEQQKIASILGSVDESIQATQAVIDQTRKVKQGLLQHLLTRGIGHTRFKKTEIGEIPVEWEVIRLADVVSADRPITYGIVQTGSHVDGGIPCVRVVDLVRRDMCVDDMITTTPEISARYRRTILREGDIMFALRGEIGHVVIADGSLVDVNLTRGVALISPGPDVVPQYLLWAIKSPSVSSNIYIRVTGSALREIPLKELRRVRIPIPPLSEQTDIAERLLAVGNALDAEQDEVEALSCLKAGLMQDLLTGRVRVKGVA